MWLRNRNEEPDCIKTLDSHSSIVAIVIKIFKQQKFKWIADLQNILYFSKLCDFLNEGTFARTASVQCVNVNLI